MSLTVGKLAQAAGVGVETIRFYQRRGLLPQPPKRGAGYREYAPADVDRIRFIKGAQALGFTLNEIAGLLELERDARAQCGDVQARAHRKMALVDQKIMELTRMRAELQRLADCCPSEQLLSGCRLLNCMPS